MLKIVNVCGARPNFMKIAPLYHALKATDWARPVLVHTGQHYDHNMSDAILQDLRVPAPDFHLGVGSGSHATPMRVRASRASLRGTASCWTSSGTSLSPATRFTRPMWGTFTTILATL